MDHTRAIYFNDTIQLEKKNNIWNEYYLIGNNIEMWLFFFLNILRTNYERKYEQYY